jgi:hypothetical protein
VPLEAGLLAAGAGDLGKLSAPFCPQPASNKQQTMKSARLLQWCVGAESVRTTLAEELIVIGEEF